MGERENTAMILRLINFNLAEKRGLTAGFCLQLLKGHCRLLGLADVSLRFQPSAEGAVELLWSSMLVRDSGLRGLTLCSDMHIFLLGKVIQGWIKQHPLLL